jgi:hypothetical protein
LQQNQSLAFNARDKKAPHAPARENFSALAEASRKIKKIFVSTWFEPRRWPSAYRCFGNQLSLIPAADVPAPFRRSGLA